MAAPPRPGPAPICRLTPNRLVIPTARLVRTLLVAGMVAGPSRGGPPGTEGGSMTGNGFTGAGSGPPRPRRRGREPGTLAPRCGRARPRSPRDPDRDHAAFATFVSGQACSGPPPSRRDVVAPGEAYSRGQGPFLVGARSRGGVRTARSVSTGPVFDSDGKRTATSATWRLEADGEWGSSSTAAARLVPALTAAGWSVRGRRRRSPFANAYRPEASQARRTRWRLASRKPRRLAALATRIDARSGAVAGPAPPG